MTTVDIHSHVVLPDTFGKAGKYGPSIFVEGDSIVIRVGEQDSRVKLDEEHLARAVHDPENVMRELAGGPSARIEAMDAQGIDIMGVTISPLFYLYWAEPEIAVEFARVQNDSLATYCGAYPDRLFHMATLPLQDVDAACAEVDRTVAQGARGLNLGGANLGGREVDDEALWPIYAKAVEHELPLFLHPYPEHLGGGGTDDYNISWILGYLHQEAVAFTRLIFGGVLDEFPTLKVCIPHGGGFIPYQLARIDAFAPHMPGVRCKSKPSSYLHNFYFDALVHDPRARRLLVDVVGADNVVWGSNFGSPQDRADPRFLDEIDLTAEERQKIVAGNATKLFKLEEMLAARQASASARVLMTTSRIDSLAYARVDATDLDAWGEFATDVLGMEVVAERDSLHLRMDEAPWRLAIDRADRDGLRSLGWTAVDKGSLGEIEVGLRTAGIDVRPLDADAVPGGGKANGFWFTDDLEVHHEVIQGWSFDPIPVALQNDVSGYVTGVGGLGHAVLAVDSVAQAEPIYLGAFQMAVREEMANTRVGGRALFLGCNPRHHSIAIVETGAPPSVMHLMVEMLDIDDVGCSHERATVGGWEPRTPLGRHRTDHMISYYVPTPGGFDLEVGCAGLTILDEAEWVSGKEATRKRPWGHSGVQSQVRRGK